MNKIKKLDEMAKRLYEPPPQKVILLYQQNFNATVVDQERVKEKYHFCWQQV